MAQRAGRADVFVDRAVFSRADENERDGERLDAGQRRAKTGDEQLPARGFHQSRREKILAGRRRQTAEARRGRLQNGSQRGEHSRKRTYKVFDGRSVRENRNAYPVMYLKAAYDVAKNIAATFRLHAARGLHRQFALRRFLGGDIGGTQEGLRAKSSPCNAPP